MMSSAKFQIAAFSMIAFLFGGAASASEILPGTLRSGALLCPHAVHLQLMKLAGQAHKNPMVGTAAYQRNSRIAVKYNRIANARCVMLDSTTDIEIPGGANSDADGLTEIIFDAKKFWVDATEIQMAENPGTARR